MILEDIDITFADIKTTNELVHYVLPDIKDEDTYEFLILNTAYPFAGDDKTFYIEQLREYKQARKNYPFYLFCEMHAAPIISGKHHCQICEDIFKEHEESKNLSGKIKWG